MSKAFTEDQESEARALLAYDPLTGVITRKTGRACRGGKIGTVAGYARPGGYVEIQLPLGKQYAHRLAFVLMGEKCPGVVDHIDRNRGNNAWGNLRAATVALNTMNQSLAVSAGIQRNCRRWAVRHRKHILGNFHCWGVAFKTFRAARSLSMLDEGLRADG